MALIYSVMYSPGPWRLLSPDKEKGAAVTHGRAPLHPQGHHTPAPRTIPAPAPISAFSSCAILTAMLSFFIDNSSLALESGLLKGSC